MKNANGIKIINTARFLKSLRRLPKSVREKVEERDHVFRKNPFDPTLNTHKLHGRLKKFWAYSVDYSYRVIFIFRDGNEAIYYEVGPHNIYGKE